MEIVIESDPYRPQSTSPAPTTGYLRSPVSNQPLVSTSSAFYYATLPRGAASRLNAVDTLDGAPMTTSVRRVDKSGLLEIADLEPPPPPAVRQQSSRHLTGTETLSRRLERSGLLEAVPEIPDQCHRSGLASDELLAAAATARSMVERQQHLLGAETDIVESALLRRRSFATLDSQDSSASTLAHENESGLKNNNNNNNNNPTRSAQRVKFAQDEITTVVPDELPTPAPSTRVKSSVVDCLGRLSPRQRSCDSRQPMTLSNIPDVIEAHGSASTSATTTTSTSTGAPEGERAEAEGCEHTATESVEESRVQGFKSGATGPNSKVDNSIQAVHVIILSEQL